jgi:hypothetical protein
MIAVQMRLLFSVLVALPLLAAPTFQSVRPLIAKYCVGCHSGANVQHRHVLCNPPPGIVICTIHISTQS